MKRSKIQQKRRLRVLTDESERLALELLCGKLEVCTGGVYSRDCRAIDMLDEDTDLD
jgi:hypothetical protein